MASDTCDACGKTEEGVAWFAAAFRKVRLKKDKPDPGNLCGGCAGSITGKEIGAEVSGRAKA
ncbi:MULTISPECIES: hypothetical protein [Bradyrhizobium]|uniref:Uncharacterized protein n=1 Tax=Bradyrhizobium elkanii TaxID=29448 RepID=A0A8I1YBW6_BRAEL|nr:MULTISPECIES: hypothetical protein [Bradyrhizobium]MBP1297088.1 hypothetical protein [Bradyrhizobium elkanii]MCS3558971.1 hypothetical protein [Bradyrhizobium elkanii]MCS3881134.1 hypothetical protein [Bradyrhizobium elkanii]WLA44844.1 hypothetical protein QIH80_23155 [Bradyrhizobium elkanii]WLB13775.1 hypothetical protein QIH87_23290 [Bradyrhizobium elkanii]